MKLPSDNLVPPDGGWGWMVCLGYGFIIFSLRSLDASFGLLFEDLLVNLNVDTTGATFVTSLSDSIINFSGLFAGPLIKKIGFRKIAALGSILSTSGLILTSRATSFAHLICSYGILTGLGTGLAVAAGLVAVNTYFVKKRTQGMGFAMAGSSIGMMCTPQVVHLLLTHYDFRGAALVIAAISLHALLGSCLLQPVSRHMVAAFPRRDKGARSESVEESALLKGEKPVTGAERSLEARTTVSRVVANKPNSEGVEDRRAAKSCLRKIVAIFDLDMLKSFAFVNLLVGLSLFYAAEMNFKMLSSFFLASIGMPRHDVASALTLTAFADVVARLTVPTMVMRLNLGNRRVFWVGSILIGISRSVMAVQKPGKMLYATLALLGFLRGVTLTNLNVCIAEYCEIDKLPTAIGMLMVSKGLFVVALGPPLGFIRDYTGSYQICIHSMTGVIGLCSVAWGAEFAFSKIARARKVWEKNRWANETA